jgi:hypothetical protein
LKKIPLSYSKGQGRISMGMFFKLNRTVIFNNHSFDKKKQKFLDNYFEDKVKSNRISDLYSKEELESIISGPFQCLPIIINKKKPLTAPLTMDVHQPFKRQ